MRFDRLDKTVFAVVAILLAAIAIVALRGDRVGATVTGGTPADGAQRVSVRAPVTFVFSEPMDITTLQSRVDIRPPLSGTLRGAGAVAIFVPAQPLQPDTEYTLVLRAGGKSLRGRLMQKDHSLRFQTRRARIAYLTPSEENSNLVVHDPQTGAMQRITSEPLGVYDYAISPDGARAVVSINRDASGSRDLWLIALDGSSRERLLACDEQVCQTASWSADGTRIAFERRALIQRTIGKLPGPARIWLLDVASKETVPLFADTQRIASLPLWSPVDDRLVFVDSTDSSLSVIDTNTLQPTQLPSNLGDPGAWSPDGSQLIYPDIAPFDDRGFNQLLRVDFARNVITTVFPITTNNDASIAWSPASSEIAFSRQEAGTRGAIGAQIWLANADGTQARKLTQDLSFSNFRLSYSPDGRVLMAQRFELGKPYAKPQVVLVETVTGNERVLAEDASQPSWVP